MIPKHRTQVILILCLGAFTTSRSFAQSSPSAPSPAPQKTSLALQPPFDRLELLAFIAGKSDSNYALAAIRERGIDFTPDQAFMEAVAHLPALPDLREALRDFKATSAAHRSADRDQALDNFVAITADLGAKNFATAAEKYDQVILLAPNSATLQLAFASDLLSLRRYSDAETHSRRSIDLWPGDAEAHRVLAWALYGQKRYGEATQEAREALRIFPPHTVAQADLANSLWADGKYSEAIPELRVAIVRLPDSQILRNHLGACLLHTGDLDGAIEELTGYLIQFPNDAAAHYNLGAALRAKGNQEDALLHFREAARIAPDNQIYAAAANEDKPAGDDEVPATRPDDTSISKSVYTNKSIGFSLRFPKGWIVMNPDDLLALFDKGLTAAKDRDPTAPDIIAVVRARLHPLLLVVPNSSSKKPVFEAFFGIFASAAKPGETVSSKLNSAARGVQASRDLGIDGELAGPPVETEIAGQDFAKTLLNLRQNGELIHGVQYLTILKSHLLLFQLFARDPGELEKLESTMQSLRFTESPKQ